MSWKTRRNLRKIVRSRNLSLESLEKRELLFSATAAAWDHADISYSLVPDATEWSSARGSGSSVLFETLNGLAPTDAWQRNVATAFQTWANHTNLNFHRVGDDGAPRGAVTHNEDIRIGGITAGTVAGWASFPGRGGGGDITLRTTTGILTSKYWSETAFTSLLTHEIGHALGLDHSQVLGAAMGVRSPYVGLSADDIAGIQEIYGPRDHDEFDKLASNNSFTTASQLQFDGTKIDFRADLTSHADVDYYRLTVPAGGESFTLSADARQLSLLAPKVQVFDASNHLVAEASGDYGTVATVRVDNVKAGEAYTVVVDGATDNEFQMGAYQLAIEAVVNAPVAEPIADPVQETEPKAAPITEPSDEPLPTAEPTESESLPTPSVEPVNVEPTPTPTPVIPPVPADPTPTADDDLPLVEVISPPLRADVGNAVAEAEIQNPLEAPVAGNNDETEVETPHDSNDANTDDVIPEVVTPEAVVPEVIDVSPPVTIPTPTPTPTPTPIPVADPTPAPTMSLELSEFTDLLNDYRLANGLDRVILATELSDEARINNLGDTPHNYLGQSQVQNWARGYTSPSAVLQGWIGSPGHNANLLNPTVKYIGLSHDGAEWTFNGSFGEVLPGSIPPQAEPAVVVPIANPIDVDQQNETEQTEPSPTADNPDSGNVTPPPAVENLQPTQQPTEQPGSAPANEQEETAAILIVPAAESVVQAPSHGVSSSPADRVTFGRGLRRQFLARRSHFQLASRVTDNRDAVPFTAAPASSPAGPATAATTRVTTVADDSATSDTTTSAKNEEPIAAVLPITTIAVDQRPSTTKTTSTSQPLNQPSGESSGEPEDTDQTPTIAPTILRSEKIDYDNVPHDPPVVSVNSSQADPSARVHEPTVLQTLTVFRGFRRLFLASNARMTVDRSNDRLTNVPVDAPASGTAKTADAVFASVVSRDLTPDESSPSDDLLDLLAADRRVGDESPLFRRLGSTRALRSRAA